ncbi:hypothetical protein RHMOL_Rhmol01G0173700 [Rhododendron molle]|uniref:Uncharacterized protein n=1 Tax=Rhododendron molle TaxID=49168 RepID=A0ACC0Q2D2_RHOML|nr:hypothetical protein RHMOL_Rhmol01G0173700 [Rhododendron molle]
MMLRFSLKLRRLKFVLKDLNFKCFSNICSRVAQAREELSQVQSLCFSNPFDATLCAKEKEVLRTFMELSLAEEEFKKQKSRVQWLSLGDHNTRFFHQKMATNRLRNKILSITDTRGVRLEDPKEVKQVILGYFQGLLGTAFPSTGNFSSELRSVIRNKVSTDMQESLIHAVTALEIRTALFSINGDKAPGPDGYNAKFYQSNWEVIGSDLVLAVQQFFRTGFMLREWNSTAISLVPKVNAPCTVRDFRPISCCNVVYKCVSKILVSRLQPLIPSLIHPNYKRSIHC